MNKIDKRLHFLLGKVKEECKKVKNLSDYELKNKTNEEIVEEEVKEIEKKKVRIPWYVIGFFVTCALFSLKVIPVNVSHVCKTISNNLEIIALAAIGLRVNVKDLIKQGKSVSLYGLFIALLQIVSAITLIGILL